MEPWPCMNLLCDPGAIAAPPQICFLICNTDRSNDFVLVSWSTWGAGVRGFFATHLAPCPAPRNYEWRGASGDSGALESDRLGLDTWTTNFASLSLFPHPHIGNNSRTGTS